VTRAGLVLAGALLTAFLAAGGCAQFGVPEPPPALRDPAALSGALFVAYQPHTVLGLGHTGVIVADESPGRFLRFDQYASAELTYGRRLAEGRAWFWEALTARLPSIFGLTREVVTRRAGSAPVALLEPGELLVPVPGVAPGLVREAAQARFSSAGGLERESARRYFWSANNCHHFVRDVLRAGGPIHERYFPKHFVADTLAKGAASGPTPPAVPDGGP
jgi:hypothetical protein